MTRMAPATGEPERIWFDPTRNTFCEGAPDNLFTRRETSMQAGAHIGSSIRIKGELTANEDVTIAGHVEGTVKIEGHVIFVEPGGRVTADVAAKDIVVCGTVKGKLTAVDRIEIRNSGVVEGELAAPRIGIADGASIQGRIEMAKKPRVVAPKVTAA